jgi:hypothetical protein
MSDEELKRSEGETAREYIERVQLLPTDGLPEHARRLLNFEIDVALNALLRERENEQRRATLSGPDETRPAPQSAEEDPADPLGAVMRAFLTLPPDLRGQFLRWAVAEGAQGEGE